MKIIKCNQQPETSFKGLWGYKTYSKQIIKDDFRYGYTNSLPRNLELFQIYSNKFGNARTCSDGFYEIRK